MYTHARYYRLYIKELHKSYKSVQSGKEREREGRKEQRGGMSAAHQNIQKV